MIVISAASGQLGHALAEEFSALGKAGQVRLTARSRAAIEAWSDQGFAIGHADYDAPATMVEGFAGADTLILISSSDPVNETRIRQHKAAIDAAKAAGVSRIIYTSFANPDPFSRFLWAAPHVATEAYLAASGIEAIFLRDAPYAANLALVLGPALQSGVLATHGLDATIAYVTHGDVAAAAAAAALDQAGAKGTYLLTGSRALSVREIAAEVGRLTGRDFQLVELTASAMGDGLRQLGLPAIIADALVSLNEAAVAGEYATVSGDVVRLAGHPAACGLDFVRGWISER